MVKRETAFKCNIDMLNTAKYVVLQGWQPNYVLLNQVRAARINLIGVIVKIEGNSILMDDGSGKVYCRVFDDDNKLKSFKIGDVILIIGKPREYNQSKYVVIEIIRLVDKKWLSFRKKELEHIDYGEYVAPEEIESDITTVEKEDSSLNKASVLLDKIKDLDDGDGVSRQKLLETVSFDDADDYINNLIYEGEIFEIKPGFLKLL